MNRRSPSRLLETAVDIAEPELSCRPLILTLPTGLTIVIGGQYFAWNHGLTCGFGSYLIAMFLMGSGYLTLCLCLAEMTSAMPFAGKSLADGPMGVIGMVPWPRQTRSLCGFGPER